MHLRYVSAERYSKSQDWITKLDLKREDASHELNFSLFGLASEVFGLSVVLCI